MTRTQADGTENSVRRVWRFGVRARLLLAFFGITAFAILAAGAGIYAFREVGSRLDVVDTRVTPTLSALELSRSAERIIAAAPALLSATDRARRDEVKAELAEEVESLNGKLLDLMTESRQAPALLTIGPIVASLTESLAELDDLVLRRLDASERIGGLRREVFQTNAEAQRLLAPWLLVLESQIASLAADAQAAAPDGRGDASTRLASLFELQALTQTAQRQVSAVVDMLAEASTVEHTQRIAILGFQLGLALRDLDGTAASLDPKLRPLFLEQIETLREYSEGPEAVTEARARELALAAEGAELLAVTARLSEDLGAAVDRIGSAAKLDIEEAIRDALSVQRASTQILVVLVMLSLASSILIVWLYVGRNIARRLTALGDGMLAIAGGSTQTPVDAGGSDEIAAMGRAVEVFRQNTMERDRLLEEKAQTAESLEKEVQVRTAELARSIEELRALGEVSQAVSSTVNLETVLTTIVAKATQLSNTEAGAIYVFDDTSKQFQLRATYGMDATIIAKIRDHQSRLGKTMLGEAARRGAPIQIPDVQSDPSSPVLDVIVRAGYRGFLFVPLRGADRVVGALVVRRREPGVFAGSTVELLQTFAAQSVQAILNARLFEEIRDTGRQLEVANKYKSHFLASASHDLRQPLHALNLFVAQLGAASDPVRREQLFGRIDAAVGSMNELFESLLDMSKLEAGVLEQNPSEFALDRLLGRVEATFADAAHEKGLRLIVAPTRVWIRSDFILLERILFNLVSNAVRYTDEGGVLVGGRRRGGQLRIDVLDTGPGIPETQQKDVFGAYYRLAPPDRRGGLGLGLDIVDRLGRLLGHPVELSSRPGRGSRFSVTVPLAAEPLGQVEAVGQSAKPDPAAGKLVVVIDDDPLVIEGMGGILGSWGCKVLRADSEETALTAVAGERHGPDLIIADFRLADGRTGIRAIQRLRKAAGRSVPAFLISGDTAPDRLREARASGFHLLHKPVPPMRLRALVNQLLKGGDPTKSAE